MSSLPPAHHDVAWFSIREDAAFVVSTVHAIARSDVTAASPATMAFLPFFSLITYETRRWLSAHHPQAAASLPAAQAERIESIRHAAKWFEASKGGVDDALAKFRAMREDHAAEFLGNTPFRWARPLESDLGLYEYDGRVILNTHQLGILLGPGTLDGIGPELQDMGATVTAQAIAIAGDSGGGGPSFLDRIDRISNRDVKSWKYYRGDLGVDLEIVGYVHVLASTLGFLRLVNAEHPGEKGVVFKMKDLGLYQACRTLASPRLLTITDVLEVVDPGLYATEDARQLRNDLTHYTPKANAPSAALDPARPRQALAESAFSRDFADASNDVAQSISRLHDALLRLLE